MPLIDSRPDALARVYARSLFELATETGGRESAEAVLGELEEVLELARADRRFGEFLASRALSAPKRDAALIRMFDDKTSGLTFRFVRLLNAKGRLGHLSPIVAALDNLVQESFGRVEVDVFTADPMSPDALRSIKQRLSDQLGKDVIAHPYTDETMLGGIRLRIGDQLIDGSVSSQLRKMRDRLGRDGSASLRGRFENILDDLRPDQTG